MKNKAFKEIKAGEKFTLPHLPGFVCGKLNHLNYVILEGPRHDTLGKTIRVWSPTKTKVVAI